MTVAKSFMFALMMSLQYNIHLSLRHQRTRPPASARMGCALNSKRLRTELCSNHKAALTGPKSKASKIQSVRHCGLNIVRFAAVLSSKRNPCERWQGV